MNTIVESKKPVAAGAAENAPANVTGRSAGRPEILKYMESHPRLDYFEAEYLFDRERREAAEAQHQSNPPEPDSKWRITPMPDEIFETMRTHGLSFPDARAEVVRQLRADAELLSAYSPVAGDEVRGAFASADAARSRAETLMAENLEFVETLKAQIANLCALRRQIRKAKTLILEKTQAKALAASALNFWIDQTGPGASTQTHAGFRAAVEDLTFREMLKPFIGEFIARMETRAAEIIAAVRELAADKKIDLAKLLANWKADTGKVPGPTLDRDWTLLAGLLDEE